MVGVVAALVATSTPAAAATPARAAATSTAAAVTLAPDAVSPLPAPPVGVAVPLDGRLRGDGFTATVAGVATGPRLGAGAAALAAGAGQRLWVFGLRLAVDTYPDGTDTVTPTVTVVADGARTTVPVDPTTTATTWWVASVPATASDVAVEAATDGYAQRFSLAAMTREGQAPAILYRDPTSWQVTQPLALTRTIAISNAGPWISVDNGNLAAATATIDLTKATLSWFGPTDPTDLPADASRAWLTIDQRAGRGARRNPPQPPPMSTQTSTPMSIPMSIRMSTGTSQAPLDGGATGPAVPATTTVPPAPSPPQTRPFAAPVAPVGDGPTVRVLGPLR